MLLALCKQQKYKDTMFESSLVHCTTINTSCISMMLRSLPWFICFAFKVIDRIKNKNPYKLCVPVDWNYLMDHQWRFIAWQQPSLVVLTNPIARFAKMIDWLLEGCKQTPSKHPQMPLLINLVKCPMFNIDSVLHCNLCVLWSVISSANFVVYIKAVLTSS